MKFLFAAFTVIVPIATAFSPLSLSKVASTTTPSSSTAVYAENGSSSAEKKKVIVLGGDGFCGWPTSLYLSDQGHDVVIVDNLSRRKIDLDLGCDSLTPISSPETRVQAWKEVTGKDISFHNIDVAKEYDLLVQLIKEEQPDSIVHFAEQRAAPYSQKNFQDQEIHGRQQCWWIQQSLLRRH